MKEALCHTRTRREPWQVAHGSAKGFRYECTSGPSRAGGGLCLSRNPFFLPGQPTFLVPQAETARRKVHFRRALAGEAGRGGGGPFFFGFCFLPGLGPS